MNQTPIIDRIAEAVSDVPGWTPLDQLNALFSIALASSGVRGDILELGSWCGRSAIALGLAAKLSGSTRVHCVDLFPERNDWSQNADGTYSMRVTADNREYCAFVKQTVWREPFERDILPVYEKFPGTLEAFKHHISASDLDEIVSPFRGDLSAFIESGPRNLRLRLAFIDGDHGYEAVAADIRAIEQLLSPGGWICFDDAFTTYEGVDAAINDLIIKSDRYDCCQQITRKLFVARMALAST